MEKRNTVVVRGLTDTEYRALQNLARQAARSLSAEGLIALRAYVAPAVLAKGKR
jgi:hypothetical protein